MTVVKRLAITAVTAVAMAVVWVLSTWEDQRLYDEMEDEDPDEESPVSQPWEPEDADDEE